MTHKCRKPRQRNRTGTSEDLCDFFLFFEKEKTVMKLKNKFSFFEINFEIGRQSGLIYTTSVELR